MGTLCVRNQSPESIRTEVSVVEAFGGEKWGLLGSLHSETQAMLNPYCWRSSSSGGDGKVGLGEGQRPTQVRLWLGPGALGSAISDQSPTLPRRRGTTELSSKL